MVSVLRDYGDYMIERCSTSQDVAAIGYQILTLTKNYAFVRIIPFLRPLAVYFPRTNDNNMCAEKEDAFQNGI
jgi:hypothetical protein